MVAEYQIAANSLLSCSLLALSSLGFSLIYSCSRFFHFAHGVVYTLAAYTVFVCVRFLHLGPGVAMLAASIVCAMAGGLMECLLYQPLRVRGSSSLVILLASIGIYIAIQNCLSLGFGDDSKVVYDSNVIPGVLILDVRLTYVQLRSIGVSAGVLAATWQLLQHTRFGKSVRALADDPGLALALGVPIRALSIGVFALGSMLAAFAGAMGAWDGKISPTMGMPMLMASVVVVIIGGVGRFGGTISAALLVSGLQQVSAWYLGSRWQDVGVFLALLFFLIIRPEGVRGLRERGWSV